MNKLHYLKLLSPEELLQSFIGFYLVEYGEKKTGEILDKLRSSPQVNTFIDKLRREKLSPGKDGFLSLINSMPYFLFTKAETMCCGVLLAITYWRDKSVNDKWQFSLFSLHDIIIYTILEADKTKLHLTRKLSFFDRYFDSLETALK